VTTNTNATSSSQQQPPPQQQPPQQHYIAASYVKWLEAGGARSIPIPYDADPALLDELWTQMHALFLPGGDAVMPPAVPYLLDKIRDSNTNAQHYFPVWGTCLGFEYLIQYVSSKTADDDDDEHQSPDNNSALQSGFDATNISLPLENVRQQAIYADPDIYETVRTCAVTMNNHHQGIEPQHFMDHTSLTAVWNITSTNHDRTGRPFVSTVEPLDPDRFPVWGVQYHPEKNAFEYATYPGTTIPYEAIDHSEPAVAFSMYMARFVVDLARRTVAEHTPEHDYTKPDRFPTVTQYPMQTGIKFEQIYLIPNASHWTKNTEPRPIPESASNDKDIATSSHRKLVEQPRQ
jgi:gamma-glutamyl hydrolase